MRETDFPVSTRSCKAEIVSGCKSRRLGFRPSFRPVSSPSFVRWEISRRSNCAMAPKTWNTNSCLPCGKACNVVPQRGAIGDQVGPALICCRNSFLSSTPFRQATTERPAGLICVEEVGLARRRLPQLPFRPAVGSKLSAECGTALHAD